MRTRLDAPQVRELDAFQIDPQVFEDGLRLGQHGDIAQHRFAAVAVTGSLHGTHAEDAAQLVHDQRGQRFAFDVFGDDQQRLIGLADRLQQRDQVLVGGDFLFEDQHVAVFKFNRDVVRVGNEMRREETAIKLHSLDDFDRRLAALAFFDGDHAVFADLQESIGQHIADRRVVVTGDRGDLLDLFLALGIDGLGHAS